MRKLNQIVSQRPIFSSKASIFIWTQHYNTKGGWQIQYVNQQIKLNATVIKNVLTSLIQTQFHLSYVAKLTPLPSLNPLDKNSLSESYNPASLCN